MTLMWPHYAHLECDIQMVDAATEAMAKKKAREAKKKFMAECDAMDETLKLEMQRREARKRAVCGMVNQLWCMGEGLC